MKIGALLDEENIDVDDPTTVLASVSETMMVSFRATDAESGIDTYYVGIGTAPGNVALTPDGGTYIEVGNVNTFVLTGLELQEYAVGNQYYYITVYAKNGAGLESDPMSSLRIKLLAADKAGTVNDGREFGTDIQAQFDETSVAVNFDGFESELCGIAGYKVGIGQHPNQNDLLAYTSVGVVMRTETAGVFQVNLALPENTFIYVIVIAITGTGCPNPYIPSPSTGFWVDCRSPDIMIQRFGESDFIDAGMDMSINYYQETDDTVSLQWLATDDESGYDRCEWRVGTCPRGDDLKTGAVTTPTLVPLGEIIVEDGQTVWGTIDCYDKTDNMKRLITAPLTIDATTPTIEGLTCDRYVSSRKMVITCRWYYNYDNESPIDEVTISIGPEPGTVSITPTLTRFLNTYVNQHNIITRFPIK